MLRGDCRAAETGRESYKQHPIGDVQALPCEAPMSDRTTETRTAFEAWFAGHRFMHRYSLQKERDGTYQWHQVQIAWEAWQAASSPEPAAEYEARIRKFHAESCPLYSPSPMGTKCTCLPETKSGAA